MLNIHARSILIENCCSSMDKLSDILTIAEIDKAYNFVNIESKVIRRCENLDIRLIAFITADKDFSVI